MSKNNAKPRHAAAPPAAPAPAMAAATPFKVPFPALLLALAVLVTYFSSFGLGFTELDDTIFIKEFAEYNENTQNLLLSFTRGLFDPVKDPYYRPLFSDAMILNYQLSGDGPGGYHFVNILLHMGAVLLLYRFTARIGIKPLHGFIIALVFAVHPVLCQAVAWIPGRNDTMLAVFVLLFLLYAFRYTASGRVPHLLASALCLLCAYFSKETAVFAAPAALVLLVLYTGHRWNSKALINQYVAWVACFAIWYAARSAATIQASGIGSAAGLADILRRPPVILQYLGKIFLPVNQSVFPTQQDTALWPGIAALGLLITAIGLNKERDNKAIAASLIVFLLFLMPALLVPQELNKQTFEHRLYLPMAGILLLLPQTVLFANRLAPQQLLLCWGMACLLFMGLNYRHQQYFDSPQVFWQRAAETSPNSAYANMMLAARLDKSEVARSEALFRKAYAIDPREKYLNYYMAEMLQRKDSVLASEPYLLAEKKISDYFRCDFYLARVYMEKGDKPGAATVLERYLARDRFNEMAHNNLLLLLIDTQQLDKAKTHIREMRKLGVPVPGALAAQLGV